MSFKESRNESNKTLEIIACGAEKFEIENRYNPKILKLPFRMAIDLSKGGRDQVGYIAGKAMRFGVNSLDGELLFGMRIQIVRGNSASLSFE